MTRHRFLETFDGLSQSSTPREQDTELIDAARAEGFEAGYESGWEDAIASDKTSRIRMAAEFERNIQGLAFTFSEAVAHVRGELRNFLGEIVDTFLPAIAPEALRSHIKAELQQLGEAQMDAPVEIVTSPDCNQTISEMLKSDFSFDVSLVEDTTLSAGQVFVRLGSRELEFDLDPLIEAISVQLRAICAESDLEEIE